MQSTNVTHRIAWSLSEVSIITGLSLGFLRKEVKRGNLKAQRKGRRVIIVDRDLKEYFNQPQEQENE
jgi:hypothetical protein